MARTKKQRKKKEKKYKHKSRVYFSANDYNNFLYDNFRHGRRRQRGSFLNRYDFAYAGRNTVNQAAKHLDTLAPKLVNQLMSKVLQDLIISQLNESNRFHEKQVKHLSKLHPV